MSDSVRTKFRHHHHKIKDRIRDLKVEFFSYLFGSNSQFLTTVSFDSPILVLRLDNKIGDSIAATGFLRELKKNNQQSKITVLAGQGSSLIYKKLPFIDQVIVAKKGFFSTLFLFLKLRKYSFKFIINTSHMLNPRVIFLCSQLKANKKSTFLNKQFKTFSDHVEYNETSDHVTIRYLNTLRLLNGEALSTKIDYEIRLDQSQEVSSQNSIQELRRKFKKIIILNSFAGARFRNFSQQTTEQIVKYLTVDSEIVVVSIGNHNDLHLAESWIAAFESKQWICFAGAHDLNFNFGLVKYSDVVITPDTALVHVASAFKKKLVAVFREDRIENLEKNASIWAPYQANAKVIIAPYDKENPEDINSVSAREVADAALALLK